MQIEAMFGSQQQTLVSIGCYFKKEMGIWSYNTNFIAYGRMRISENSYFGIFYTVFNSFMTEVPVI